MRIPTPHQQLHIAARADVSAKTVARAYRGERIRDTGRARIERAAQELGLPPPPPREHAEQNPAA